MAPDGSNKIQLTSTEANDHSAAYSPDGSKIAFKRSHDAFGTDGDIYLMNANGSNQTPITTGGQVNRDGIVWSPDGSKILFNVQSVVQQFIGSITIDQIYSIKVDGTNKENLSNNQNYDLRRLAAAVYLCDESN